MVSSLHLSECSQHLSEWSQCLHSEEQSPSREDLNPCRQSVEQGAFCSLGVKSTWLTLMMEDTHTMLCQTLSDVSIALICTPSRSAPGTSSQPRNPSRTNEEKAKDPVAQGEESLSSQKSAGVFHQTREAGHSFSLLWAGTWQLREEGIWGLTVWGDTVHHDIEGMAAGVLTGLITVCPQSEGRRETGKGTQTRNLKAHPSAPFPPVRSHFEASPQVETECSDTGVYGGHFMFKTLGLWSLTACVLHPGWVPLGKHPNVAVAGKCWSIHLKGFWEAGHGGTHF